MSDKLNYVKGHSCDNSLADIRGALGMHAPPSGSNFFNFHAAFWENFGQIIDWHPHLGGWWPPWEILDPSGI